MLSHELCLLVTCLTSLAAAIRVDWNTNKGPIVPPTPRTTVRPLPPYREPAPVWEDQSNDIPNPNPYIYILPPPSRPRPATNNYLTSDRRPVTQTNYYNYNNNRNYGQIITPADVSAYFHHGNPNVVASLSPNYVPNVGIKYSAVVSSNNNNSNGQTATRTTTQGFYFGALADKVQGKFNAKTKKYKAYEKVKYVPLNYFPLFDFALPEEQAYIPEFDQEQLMRTQQLPLEEAPSQAFNSYLPTPASKPVSIAEPTQRPPQPTQAVTSKASSAKFAHEKDTGALKKKSLDKSTKEAKQQSKLSYITSNAIVR